jgi:hypothetical protein
LVMPAMARWVAWKLAGPRAAIATGAPRPRCRTTGHPEAAPITTDVVT